MPLQTWHRRDNCPDCEGTGQKIDFKEIREVIENPRRFDIAEILKSSKRRNKYLRPENL